MALIRSVKRHENSRMWAYIESSDECTKEHPNMYKIMGDKDFQTKEEAEDYAKGFEIGSYVWIEPVEIKMKRLLSEKEKIQKRLNEIDIELQTIKQ